MNEYLSYPRWFERSEMECESSTFLKHSSTLLADCRVSDETLVQKSGIADDAVARVSF